MRCTREKTTAGKTSTRRTDARSSSTCPTTTVNAQPSIPTIGGEVASTTPPVHLFFLAQLCGSNFRRPIPSRDDARGRVALPAMRSDVREREPMAFVRHIPRRRPPGQRRGQGRGFVSALRTDGPPLRLCDVDPDEGSHSLSGSRSISKRPTSARCASRRARPREKTQERSHRADIDLHTGRPRVRHQDSPTGRARCGAPRVVARSLRRGTDPIAGDDCSVCAERLMRIAPLVAAAQG